MENNSNAGFTLVEVLVALAISSVIMIAMTTVMVVGSKSYKKTSEEVEVQAEAQTTLNFINNLLIDAQYIEYKKVTDTKAERFMAGYYIGQDYSGTIVSDEKEIYRIMGEGVAGYNYLCVAKDIDVKTSELNMKTVCYVIEKDKKLYYGKVVGGYKSTGTDIHSIPANKFNKEDSIKSFVGNNKYLLADYLQDTNGFTLTFKKNETVVDAHTRILDSMIADIGIKMQKTAGKYETINEVGLRNF